MQPKTDHDYIVEMHSALFDKNGNPGLCSKVEAQGKAITRLWITVGIMAASTGGGAFAIVRALVGN